jgi:hypothetical protein
MIPGAMLEEPIKQGDTSTPKMKGSAMLIGAATREEVLERVKKDVYVGEGVWGCVSGAGYSVPECVEEGFVDVST